MFLFMAAAAENEADLISAELQSSVIFMVMSDSFHIHFF